MSKITFNIDPELKKEFLEALEQCGEEPDTWFMDGVNDFLAIYRTGINPFEEIHNMDAINELANKDIADPKIKFRQIAIQGKPDMSEEEIQKLLIESIQEGFAKHGINIGCFDPNGIDKKKLN